MKKLYVSDLDGTLLSHNSKLSDYTREKLHELLASNVFFTIASARSLTTIKEILLDIPLKIPVITLNGAVVVDYKNEKEIVTVHLPSSKVQFITTFLQEHKANFILNTKHKADNRADKCWMPFVRNKPTEDFYQERLLKKDPRIVLFKSIDEIDFSLEKVVSFTIIEKPDKCHDIYQRLFFEEREKLCVYPMGVGRDGWQWMTVQDEQANKGHGVKQVASSLGISLANTVVFGDNVNDSSIFKLAGLSCAMANASEEVKKNANKEIPYHFNDSVAKHILSSEGMLP